MPKKKKCGRPKGPPMRVKSLKILEELVPEMKRRADAEGITEHAFLTNMVHKYLKASRAKAGRGQ